MIVRCLRPGDGKAILEARRQSEVVDANESSYEAGVGETLPEERILAALNEIKAVMWRYEMAGNASAFDSEASVTLHRSLRIDPISASNGDFWVWLAVSHFHETIEWRHASENGAHLRNYGIGNKWDNLLARLWFRADTCYDSSAGDPYWLARRGAIDFWESGIIRVRYASCRALARAFARYQYPEANDTRGILHPTNPNGIRQLYKRLKRLHATVAYECLDDAAASALIEDLASDLVRT